MNPHLETALVPYFRGELNAAERDNVARHLADCAQCRQSLDSLVAVSAELARQVERMRVPDGAVYRAQLRRRLAARKLESRPRWRPRLAWAAFATAGVAAAALAFLLMLPGRPGAPPVDQLAMETEMSDANIDLLRSYPVVEHLDLLEDYDVIEHLDELPPVAHPNDEIRS